MIHVAGNSVVDLLYKGVPNHLGAIDGWSAANVCFMDRSPEAVLGGNGASVAYLLGHLGNKVVLNTQIGVDVFGNLIQGWLDEARVQLLRPPEGSTSVNTILLDRDGTRRSIYFTGRKVDWERSINVGDADWFYASGYGQIDGEDLKKLVVVFENLRSLGISIMFDPGPWFMRTVEQPDMESAWGLTDCIAGTKEELQTWGGKEDPIALAENILGMGPSKVVIKQGAEGVTVAERGFPAVSLKTQSRHSVNTVGAGDTFNAGLIHGLMGGYRLREAAQTGLKLAMKAVASGRGAMGVFDSNVRRVDSVSQA